MRDRLKPYLHLAALLTCQGLVNAGTKLEETGHDLKTIGRVLFAAVERSIEK